MRFKVFFCDFGLNRSIKERVQQCQFLFFCALGNDGDEVDELGVVDGAVELAAVFNHEEYLVRQVRVLDVQKLEVL